MSIGLDLNLTRTKIVVPRRPDTLLTRQRLLDPLYSIIDYRLFLVIAPAGYGKTSALMDWAHQAELPLCWYAVDEFDQDARQFIAYVIAALAERFPDFGARSAAALRSMTQDLDLARLVQVIVNEAYEHIREHFALVIDDYHLVQQDDTISAFISRLAQQVDENCHIVLVSRTLLALPELPLMIARAQVSGFGYEELAFRPEEVQDLVLQNHHLTLSSEEAQALTEEAEGWVTGLLLSAQTMWQGTAGRVRTARLSGLGLYDYMAEQTLEQQPPEIRDFLLRTSLFEVFNAELCEAVLNEIEDLDWASLMDSVLRSNLFVVPVGGTETWLRYHHLFRDFLRDRMQRDRPDEYAQLLRRIGDVYRARRLWDRAYAVYERLGDQEATARLIEQAGFPLIKAGQIQRLQRWLEALTQPNVTAGPSLLSLQGVVASMTGDPKTGARLQSQAEEAYRAAGDQENLARVLIRQAVDQRLLGDYEASLRNVAQVLKLVEERPDLAETQAEAYRDKGLCLYWMGQPDMATTWLNRASVAYAALGNEHFVAIVHMELGLVYMNMGDYSQALESYNHSLELASQTEDPIRQATLYNNLGVLYHYRGDYREAVRTLERAITEARQSAYPRMEGSALAGLGDVYTELGAHEAAAAAYSEALRLAQRMEDRFLSLYVVLAQAALSCARERYAQAQRCLDTAREQVEESQASYERGFWHLIAGRLALHQQDEKAARAELQAGVEDFEAGKRRLEGARARLYLAAACELAGDDKQAAIQLEHALALSAQLGSHQALLAVAHELAPTLTALKLPSSLDRERADLLAEAETWKNQLPGLRRDLRRQSETVRLAPPRLKLQALGQVQAWVNGGLVTGADWQAQVARDAAFCLLAHPQGLTGEELGLLFWPDKDPVRLNMHLKKTLYRVRRALGDKSVLFENGRYHFNRALDYEYDVEAFREALDAAHAAPTSETRVAAYEEAVQQYQGTYLPTVDGTWVLTLREQLWQAYREATLTLIRTQLEGQAFRSALHYCQRLLTEDPCQEDVHCLAMRAHAALGDRSAVVRQFEHCKQLLAQELDVTPSPQTQTLYAKLTN